MEICFKCCGVLCVFAWPFILTLPLGQPDSALMAVTCVCLARHGLAALWLLLLVIPSATINNSCFIHLLLNPMRRLFCVSPPPAQGAVWGLHDQCGWCKEKFLLAPKGCLKGPFHLAFDCIQLILGM